MVTKESLEDAVVYSNICLKRWARNKTRLLDYVGISGMVKSWLVRVLSRSAQSYACRNMKRSLYFDYDEQRQCIMNLCVANMTLPVLDYDELNQRAVELMVPRMTSYEVEYINFRSIEKITF